MFTMNFTNMDTQTKKKKKGKKANTMSVREKTGWGFRDGRWKGTKIKRDTGNKGEKRKNSLQLCPE